MSEPDTQNIGSGLRLDHLLISLLARNDGVFLGECHDCHSVIQSIDKLLPLLKANGVQTISYEYSQKDMDAIAKYQSYEEYFKKHNGVAVHKELFDLARHAKRLGIRVLGHEHPKVGERDGVANTLSRHATTDEEIFVAQGLWQASHAAATSEEGMRSRDDHAADHIKRHRIGKTVVIGGMAHGGEHTKDEGIQSSVANPFNYRGLDKRLGFPSVDYQQTLNHENLGLTEKADGKFSDYTVKLDSFICSVPGCPDKMTYEHVAKEKMPSYSPQDASPADPVMPSLPPIPKKSLPVVTPKSR